MTGETNTTEESARQRFATLTSDLQKLGRPTIEFSESPYFGDFVVMGTWPEIQVRLVQDRGLERAEVRPAFLTDDWFDVPLILLLLGGPESDEIPTVEEQMRLFFNRLPEVLVEFRPEKWNMTKQKLESMQKGRAQRRFGLGPRS